MKKLRNTFSISRLADRLECAIARFPLTILACIALTLTIPSVNEEIYWLAALGCVGISLTVSVFCEDRVKQWVNWLISLGAVVLWLALFLARGTANSTGRIAELLAFNSLFFVAFFTILFTQRQPDDRHFWNYCRKILSYGAIALTFALVLLTGLGLAYIFLISLNDSYSSNIFEYIASGCIFFVFPTMTLCYIPERSQLQDNSLNFSKLLKIFTQYCFLPLLALYFFILYFYLLFIIVSWDLPKGTIVYMVSASVLFYLLLLFLSYPAYMGEENRIWKFVAHYGALLALPLVALMSVCIGYRIAQYGITIMRCYVVALNLWFYGILLYLFFTKSRKIKWIPISFAVILLAVSVGPWSIANSTFRHISRSLVSICEKEHLLKDGKLVADKVNEYELAHRHEVPTPLLTQYKYLRSNFEESECENVFESHSEENFDILDSIYWWRSADGREFFPEVETIINDRSFDQYDISDYQHFAVGHTWTEEDGSAIFTTNSGKRFAIPDSVIVNMYKTRGADLSYQTDDFLIIMQDMMFTGKSAKKDPTFQDLEGGSWMVFY